VVLRISTFIQRTNLPQSKEDRKNRSKQPAVWKRRRIVLDLRNSTGGLLNQAIMSPDAFLDAGEIVSCARRDT
jgi:C-terminal processing protease CtpA/Prc